MTSRSLLTAACVPVLAFTLVACGGGSDSVGGEGGATSTSTTSSSTTVGGTGGSTGGAGTGGGVGSGTSKPVCESPGAPTGPTPEPRGDTAGALSPDGRAFVIFGGDIDIPVCGSTAGHTHVGDTWVLDTGCGTWTKVESAGPEARSRHAMALDASRNRALSFGGRTRAGTSGPYTLFNDVWAFDFAAKAWSLVTTSGTPPSKRSNAGAAVVKDKLVVFGGNTSTSGLTFTPQNDTWVLDLTTNVWSKLSPSGAPKARLFHAMAADPSGNRAYVYGGGDANAFLGPFFTDTYMLDLDASTFTNLDVKSNGEGRIKLGLSATTGDSGPVLHLFGGHDDGVLGNRNDVLKAELAIQPTSWAGVQQGDVFNSPATAQCEFPVDFTTEDANSPERRSAFAFGGKSDGTAFVIFGGDSDCGRLSDAYWFDVVKGVWEPIRQTLPGLTCLRTGSTTCTSMCG